MADPINIFTDQTGNIVSSEIPVGDDPVTVRVDGLTGYDFLIVLRKAVTGHTQPADHPYPAGWEPWRAGSGVAKFDQYTNEIVVFGKGNKAIWGRVARSVSAEYQV